MRGKSLILGVSGGIAAYKACELASRLTQDGATVHVVMTAGAQQFVTPLSFQALTHQPVHTSLWPDGNAAANAGANAGEAGVYAAMAHIGLADSADAILIAPASANLLARLAHGLADDLLSTLVLATRAPVLIAPAMNPTMLAHPATQKNLATLRELGYAIIEPESGRMACEHVGAGRLPPTEVLVARLGAIFAEAQRQDLAGKRVLITAGPTREALDPVRFLSNRSSGRMGYSLAEAAAARGAETILISGPCRLATPHGVLRIDVTTTEEMFDAVMEHAPRCDIVIGAAAPADFRAATPAPRKIKKRDGANATLNLELVATPDIIAAVGAKKPPHQIVVGFAAETGEPRAEAQRKLRAKHLDAIVANDVTLADAGFEVDTNRVLWITARTTEAWPLLSKREVAARILAKLSSLA
ncbi:MAG TPA: bifunctional phosphopantothenoylcysteine decarboxylase/phosphopantothenate--cysteine ligase CoaBC [Abditibacteriaceae bacterium]|nr:bifunctional phosphopantothenoylcysteine decarboxylase/phosphopantothenate--cysteine ligase CoaBC [Abditibacteriaceae bacterium]